MPKTWILWFWSATGLAQPFVVFGISALIARWLYLRIQWRWYWDYLAFAILFATTDWGLEQLANLVGQAIMRK